MSKFSILLTIVLALTLIVYTASSYPPTLVWGMVAGTFLLVAVGFAGRGLISRRHGSKHFSIRAALPSPVAVFSIVLSASVTIQTLVAREMYGRLRAIDSTPGYALVAWALHALVVVAAVLLERERDRELGLGVAMVYTSTFYTPTFDTTEAAPPFVPLAALALVLLAATLTAQSDPSGLPGATADGEERTARFLALDLFGMASRVLVPLLLFVLLALVASLFSYSRHASLEWWLKLAVLVAFVWLAPRVVRTTGGWKWLALLAIFLSVAIPAILSLVKLFSLTWRFDLWSVMEHRLSLNELGYHNLIARSLVGGLPLLVAWAITTANRGLRIGLWCLAAVTLLIMLAVESWSAWIAMGCACLFVLVLKWGRAWASWWRNRRFTVSWWLLHLAIIVVAVAGFLALTRWAPQERPSSYSGRLLKFQSTLDAILDHPLSGVGPGHYHLMSRYYSGLDWLIDSQVATDDPVRPVYRLSEAMILHTHNLFLEFGLGMGLLGVAVLVWFLIRLFQFGFRTWARLGGEKRLLFAGCLAGVVALLGWSAIDVVGNSPPFFAFPGWALVGLLLAAPRAFRLDEGPQMEDQGRKMWNDALAVIRRHSPRPLARILWVVLFFLLAIGAVVVPLISNLHYRSGFAAYQERRWDTAVDDLARASRWQPLNAKVHRLRAEALINLGRYDEAVAAYQRAADLKREFAPYHAQLGWLAWLHGDLVQATAYFEQAVEMDPREAWRDGLHADLGLAYAAQGRIEEAVPLFQGTVELDPQMAAAPYWVPVPAEDGEFDVVLDPVYQSGPVYLGGPSPELETRILAHLGKADFTPRLFAPDPDPLQALSFHRVLDAIEADFEAAHAAGGREAPRLLATAAEAARLAGFEDRAERAYLAFQDAFPGSAYGYRDLGTLYREQGHLEEAQEMLELAVEVSPRDADSWLELAEVYLARGLWAEVERALDAVYRIKPLTARLYDLQVQLHLKQEETSQAAKALHKSLVIAESVPNRLALAGLYRQLGDSPLAVEQCTAALDALLRTWPRPLDPQLWAIGACLAESSKEDLADEILDLAGDQPLIGNVLLGHAYRVRGQAEAALTAYQAAAVARPAEGAPHYFLGETYQALGQPDQAAEEYRLAAQRDATESLPLLALGRLQWAQGQQAEAVESYRAAVEATPGWGPAQVALGNALLALGDREAAALHYRQAQMADGHLGEGLIYDLAAQVADAEIVAAGPEYVRNDYFTIGGDERRVLFMHPDARARYHLALPGPAAGGEEEEGELFLVFDVATAPESWQQPGDGVTFAVYVESEQGTRQVWSTYVDPKGNEEDRRWHAFTVDLSEYAGQTIVLILETDGGPAGDLRFDWAGWGMPRLVMP